MEKLHFEDMELELITFGASDVIATSGDDPEYEEVPDDEL